MFGKLLKSILLPAVCSAVTLSAAEVGSVKFIQEGSHPVPTELLSVVLRLCPGMEFNAAHMDEDLKNLYKTGKISDAVSEFRTTLTIKNLSFSDITEVKWNNITFEPNGLEKEIEIGNFVKKRC